MNSGRTNIWLCKAFAFVLILNIFGISQGFAVHTPAHWNKTPGGLDPFYKQENIFFQEAADGFCSWFILQYMRGYKPFVTMMSDAAHMGLYGNNN